MSNQLTPPPQPTPKYFPPDPFPNACYTMFNTSSCRDTHCRSQHGVSVRDHRARECPAFVTHSYCQKLWAKEGCDLYHGRKNE
jgi:hypothetical protein